MNSLKLVMNILVGRKVLINTISVYIGNNGKPTDYIMLIAADQSLPVLNPW